MTEEGSRDTDKSNHQLRGQARSTNEQRRTCQELNSKASEFIDIGRGAILF